MTKSEIAISENANCAQNAKKRPNFATKGVYYLKVEGSLIRQLWGAPHPTYHERPPTPQIAGGYYPGPDCYTRPLSAPSTAGTTTTHFPNQESARQARARDLEFCSISHRCPFDICEISTPQARMPSLR